MSSPEPIRATVRRTLDRGRVDRKAVAPLGSSAPAGHPTLAKAAATDGNLNLAVRVQAEMSRERARREARRRLDAEERGAIPQPEILTLRERLARPRVASAWRIAGWQPRDLRVMLAAQYKAGKTTTVGGVVRCLVDDDLHPGRAVVTPVTGTVALLDTEISAGQLEDWLGAQRIRNDDRVVVVLYAAGWRRSTSWTRMSVASGRHACVSGRSSTPSWTACGRCWTRWASTSIVMPVAS